MNDDNDEKIKKVISATAAIILANNMAQTCECMHAAIGTTPTFLLAVGLSKQATEVAKRVVKGESCGRRLARINKAFHQLVGQAKSASMDSIDQIVNNPAGTYVSAN